MEDAVIQRTDLAISQLTTNGGVLLPEQSNRFIRNLIDQPTILRDMRVQPMSGPEMIIPKVGFGQRILRVAPQGTSPYAADDGSNSRHLAASKRVAPTTGKVTLKTKEVMAEIHIPYDVLEDNIEKEGFEQTVLDLASEQAALDLEELILLGDTASADEYLALTDGIFKRCNSHVVDGTDIPVDAELWNEMQIAMPTKYKRNRALNRLYVSHTTESNYRLKISKRQTGLGDSLTTGLGPLPVFGTPMAPAVFVPDTKAILGNPKNFILGIQRNISLERDRDIRGRIIVLVMTARIDVQVEEKDAVVVANNIGAVTP